MPSKKKKYNARFPPARIKKIMQTDEEVGKVAAAVPVIISRALELFVESLLTKAVQITSAKNAKTLSPAHLKQCILAENRFDFLKDLVLAIPDVQAEGEDVPPVIPSTASSIPPSQVSTLRAVGVDRGSSTSRSRGSGRPRGRPRKVAGASSTGPKSDQRVWENQQSDGDESETDSDDNDDEDEENNSEHSTDTDSFQKGLAVTRNGPTSAGLVQKSPQFNAVQPNFYQEISAQNNSPFEIHINMPASTTSGVGDGQKHQAATVTANPEDDDYDT